MICKPGFSGVHVSSGITPPLSGLVARYKPSSLGLSDGAAVSSLTDLSGNGYHATQSDSTKQPIIKTCSMTGKPGLWIGYGSDIYGGYSPAMRLDLPSGLSVNKNSCSIITILENRIFGGYVAAPIGIGYGGLTGMYQNNAHGSYLSNSQAGDFYGLGPGTPGPEITAFTSGGSGVVCYRNELSQTAGALGSQVFAGGQIGNFNATDSDKFEWAGFIYEVFIYNRAITPAEYAVLLAYAKQAYLVNNPRTKQVVFTGDSITAGSGAAFGTGWVAQLAATNALWKTVKVVNMGVPSRTLQDMSVSHTDVDGVHDGSLENNVCVIFAGTNDLTASATGATAYGSLTSYVASCKSAGYNKVIVVPCMTRQGIDQTQRGIYNTAIAANTCGADAVVTLPAQLMANGNEANTTYFADGTHPANAGCTLIASAVLSAINTVLA